MKLLIVPSWYPTALHPESGSFFRDQAQILKNSGIDAVVAAPVMHSLKDVFRLKNNNQIQFYSKAVVPTYLFEFSNYYPKLEKLQYARYKKNALFMIENVIKKNGAPDVIFVHSSIWAGAALTEICDQLDIPLIISEHLKEFIVFDGLSKLKKTLVENTYEFCSAIIATSSALRNSIVNIFPNAKSKISIIPNPVDEEIFIQKDKKVKKGCFSIICLALFRPEKRLDLVIQSFYELIQSGENAKLIIVGDGPLKHELINHIKNLDLSDFIKLKGYLSQNQIVKELHNNDIFISASDVETFGVALIEAQACGLPVVSTNCGGPSDIISSETGILVNSGSSKELTKALIKMMDSINNYKPEIIRKKTIDQFGKLVYADAIRDLINNNIMK